MNSIYSTGDHGDVAALYDRLAPKYDKLHRRWLKHAGGEAQAALEASVRAIVTPDKNLLDAGSGTGAFARALISEGMSPACVTLLDPSEAMLARCADIPALKVNGRLESLPFADGQFDIVTCAWALETVARPEVALGELCRVVRPGCTLCITFCANMSARTAADWLMRQSIIWRGRGRFLSREHVVRMPERSGKFEVRSVPSLGPAATLIARRIA